MTRRRIRRPLQRAFTLIELLLVLVILAVLTTVVVLNFRGRGEQARVTAAKTSIADLEKAMGMFEVDCGRFPSSDEGLEALVQPPPNVQGWRGPYIKEIPLDPWNNPYLYRFPSVRRAGGIDILSFGPDGREGNDDIAN